MCMGQVANAVIPKAEMSVIIHNSFVSREMFGMFTIMFVVFGIWSKDFDY